MTKKTTGQAWVGDLLFPVSAVPQCFRLGIRDSDFRSRLRVKDPLSDCS